MNETMKASYTKDSFIEGDKLFYFYSGHDGDSFIHPIKNIDELLLLIKHSRLGDQHFYFEYVVIEGSQITIY